MSFLRVSFGPMTWFKFQHIHGLHIETQTGMKFVILSVKLEIAWFPLAVAMASTSLKNTSS